MALVRLAAIENPNGTPYAISIGHCWTSRNDVQVRRKDFPLAPPDACIITYMIFGEKPPFFPTDLTKMCGKIGWGFPRGPMFGMPTRPVLIVRLACSWAQIEARDLNIADIRIWVVAVAMRMSPSNFKFPGSISPIWFDVSSWFFQICFFKASWGVPVKIFAVEWFLSGQSKMGLHVYTER